MMKIQKSAKNALFSCLLCYNDNINQILESIAQEVSTMTRGIRVKNTDDIQKINKIVTKYGFDIWIHGKSGMVDAKSLLGMFLLSLNEPLQIVLEDDVDPTALFKDLADYLEIDDED